ncbi:MAG: HNH endonuclease [Azoarcus sp.]|nr:HNH endonuclease [Azoarcus sp.]
MNANPSAVKNACDEIMTGSMDRARDIISTEYPFFPLSNSGRTYSTYQKTKIFLRDGFIDRYSGDRLVFPAVLRLFSCIMPIEFPFHKNWKTSECHIAYWQLHPTVDHIVPVSRGGADNESNWVCTSQLKNSAKSNWLLEELDWTLHEPGRLDDWDGLIYWYIKYIDQHGEFLKYKYLSSWYYVAKSAIESAHS